MDIKEWKKFSDYVDSKNSKAIKEVWDNIGSFYPGMYVPTLHTIKKTEENFWEWKCNKL